jgi:hypothetical protein
MKKFPEYDIFTSDKTCQYVTDASFVPLATVMDDVKEKLATIKYLTHIQVYYTAEEFLLFVPYSSYGTKAFWTPPKTR